MSLWVGRGLPHCRTHKGSLVQEWWQDASNDSWAQGCQDWAGLGRVGHSATGGPVRALSSESQLPLGWLARSPAAWRGEGLAALSQEEQKGRQREAVLALGFRPKGNKIQF